MEMLQGIWKQHLRPHAVVGYGVKIFLPSPPNYVTRSPGTGNLHIPLSMTDYKRDVLTFWYCPLGCRPFSMVFNHTSSLGRSFFRKESAVRSSSCNLAKIIE